MDKKFPVIALMLVAVGAAVGGFFGKMPVRTSAEAGVTTERVAADYNEALGLIEANYAGKVDHERITDSSMQATLWTLDPHSSFFSQAELRKMDEEQASQFYGIGVSIL